jgi:SAM-dependent methyltransferase
MIVSNLSKHLYRDSDGVWRAPKIDKISYTKDGHNLIKESEKNSFWFKHRRECILIIAKKFKINFLLDVGGGNGHISSFLIKQKVEYLLLEPGTQAINNAIAEKVKTVINCSLKEAKFENDSIPTIGLFDVLEHIEDDIAFLEEIHRVLKVDGRLLLTVPAHMILFSNFDKEVGHFRRYSLNNLVTKLRKTGFEIEYRTYFFLPLLFPMIIFRKLRKHDSKTKNRRENEHFKKQHMINRVLAFVVSPEKWLMKMGFSIPFGSSCLVVVKRRKNVG